MYLNPLKPTLVFILFDTVRTSKRTHFTFTTINWLILFKEVIAIYNEKHTKPTNTKRRVTDY
jgi:hypothetical protein